MSGNNFDDRSKWPVEGGKSFLADWEGTGAQMQQGGEAAPQADAQRIEVTGGTEVAVDIPITHVQPSTASRTAQPSTTAQEPGTWDDWHLSQDIG